MRNSKIREITLTGLLAALTLAFYFVKSLFPTLANGGTIELQYIMLVISALTLKIMFGKKKGTILYLAIFIIVFVTLIGVNGLIGLTYVQTIGEKIFVLLFDYGLPYLIPIVIV
jgi:uncharacterized membrane protein